MHQNLEKDQRDRLWEHGLHEDTIFYSMLNFFLVFESVLLGVVGLLYSKTISPEPVLKIISALGFIVTLVWGYAQIRQKRYIKIISAQAQKLDADYRTLVQIRGKGIWSLSVVGLLAYAIPVLILLVWIALLNEWKRSTGRMLLCRSVDRFHECKFLPSMFLGWTYVYFMYTADEAGCAL